MSAGLFVAGTDTGVGKTIVTAGLTGWLREAGVDAHAIKPAQTGYPPDDDAATIKEVCGDESAATCCRRLEPALAPRVAATETNTDLSYAAIRADVEAVMAAHEAPIVEGIGGLRVPLAGDREVLDLVVDLEVPTLVVSRAGLGTLNHTALSVSALEDRGVTVSGIVLNEYTGETLAQRTNVAELTRMTGKPVATVPPLATDDSTAVREGVSDHLSAACLPSRVADRLTAST